MNSQASMSGWSTQMANEFKSAAHWARALERAQKRVSEAWTELIFILVIEKRTKLKKILSEPYERTLFYNLCAKNLFR